MPLAEFTANFPVSPEALFDWHALPGALQRLLPPWAGVRILSEKGSFADHRVVLSVPVIGPLRWNWVAQHSDCVRGKLFRDSAVSGPFPKWVHTHEFFADGDGCRLRDSIDYEPPLGRVGRLLGQRFVANMLRRMFRFRHARTAQDLARHAEFADRGRLRVVISGASGLIGTMLRAFLTTGGHEVRTLVRREANQADGEIQWDPSRGLLNAAALEGVDAVIHLSGRSIAVPNWTAAKKADFLRSRVDGTYLLAKRLSQLANPPRVMIAAAATGIYGDRGDELLTEDASPGEGFIPDLCRQWEEATAPARDAGIRVVHLRIGVMLSALGGALPQMLTPFRLGLGGPVGTGRQYLSWIGCDDLLGVFLRSLFDERLSGPVNVVSPQPVTNAELTVTLARVLRRPAMLSVPAGAVTLLLGEMGRTLLLESARVVPSKLEAAGFRFLRPSLVETLRWELGLD
jgi:uncharacterized protein (TIGR01777 family)